jgi:hypothetical protein
MGSRVNKYIIKYSLPNYAEGVLYTYLTLQVNDEVSPKSVFFTILQQIVNEVKEEYGVDITFNEINIELLNLCDQYETDGVDLKESNQLNVLRGKNAKK